MRPVRMFLMPCIAAGTFPLNLSWYGIPCIGNHKVDTQKKLFPELSVDVNDMEKARYLANKLYNDKKFYENCSKYAKEHYNVYYNINVWKNHMLNILN